MRTCIKHFALVLATLWAIKSTSNAQSCDGVGGDMAFDTTSMPALDGFLDTNLYTLVTEDPYAAPVSGGSTNNSDATDESSAVRIYDCNSDPDVSDFSNVDISGEGHTADIKKFYVTWDATNLYLAVQGPNAFHRGFGAPDRADMFIAIDTADSRCSDTTPVARKGGDNFTKSIDFAGWQPNYFIGVEFITNGSGSGYTVIRRAYYDSSGNVTSKVTMGIDTTPNTVTNSTIEFEGRRDTALTEFRIKWSAFGGKPDSCTGAPWNFAIYTTGDLDNYDAYDTAPGLGQSTTNFEMLGDVPFDGDHVGTGFCGGCNAGCGDGVVDPATGSLDSSGGYGEDDHHTGAGCPSGSKVAASDNTNPFNNNEVDTIQGYFRITNIGQLPTTGPSVSCPGNISTNVTCGQGQATVTWSSPTVTTGACPIVTSGCSPASGSAFSVGITTVRCYAIDSGENSNSCTFTVTVTSDDDDAPVFYGVPAGTSVECGSHDSFLSNPGGVTATDVCDGARTVSFTAVQDPQTTCPPYIITRTWSASDLSGNGGSSQQVINVIDTTPPVVYCPSTMLTYLPAGVTGVVVTYSALATDACVNVSLGYSPSSGSVFGLGTSVVTVTAVDSCSNTSQCNFNVIVRPSAITNALNSCRSGSPTLDGYVNPVDEGWTLLNEEFFARPFIGGSEIHSDTIGESAAKTIYDTNADGDVSDFSSLDISTEGHDADIEDVYVTWDTNYIYFAVTGPNAFHTGFGVTERADLFIAIDTNNSRISDTSPVAREGGDMFAKNIDFAGWKPEYFIGLEWINNGGGSGYAQISRAYYSTNGTVTNTTIAGADHTPNTLTNSALEFFGRRDTAITEFRIRWSVFGGRPSGAPWNFAVYTTGNLDNYDAFDTAPSLGQSSTGFEVLGDVPFDGDHVGTNHCGGCNAGCGDGVVDPVTGVVDSSGGYGEDDHHTGAGCPSGAKVASSDNSNPFNNNEVDTIQEYFQVANVGSVTVASGCDADSVGITANYYNDIQLSSLAHRRLDATVDFNWGAGSPDALVGADTFSARWEGQVLSATGGTYTFYVSSDDGIRLWIDGLLLIDNWVDQATTEASGTVALAAGYHDLLLEYYDNLYDAVVSLKWSGPGVSKQVIPQASLYADPLDIPHQPAKAPLISPQGTVSAEDVHMESLPMYDADGDDHVMTDWIIWNSHTNLAAWTATGLTDAVMRTHIHLGDGAFTNDHAGRLALFFDTNYVLAVRFKDDSGDSLTQWSPWLYRPFATQPLGVGNSNESWAVHEPGFEIELASHGLQLPVNIAFHPNPGTNDHDVYYYVTELYGNIKWAARDGHLHDYATNVLNFDPLGPFPGSGEKGLGGIWVETNGNLLVTMLYAPNTNNPGVQYPKVTRFLSAPDGESSTGTVDLLLIPEESGASHQISHVEVGPDGLIYVNVGDGTVPANALSTNSYQGKILRMNPNGTPATNNIYYSPSNGTNAADYIYARGVRNPFGGAWRYSNTNYYEVENGPDIDRMVKVTNGASYGWDGSNASISNNALFRWYPITAPVNMTFVQSGPANYCGFPTQYWNYGFVSESGPTWATGPFTNTAVKNGKRVRLFEFNSTGNVVTNRPFVEYIGTGKGTCVALAAGPDGLYFSDLYKDQEFVDPTARGANIWRISWVGTNVAESVLSPAGGTFGSPTNVLVTCSTPYANLHWTTNGVDPTTNNAYVSSGQTIAMSNSATLKVKGFKAGYGPSAVTSAVFTITGP